MEVVAQSSMDLTTWRDYPVTFTPSVGTVLAEVVNDFARYVRLKLAVISADGTATLWAKGIARWK